MCALSGSAIRVYFKVAPLECFTGRLRGGNDFSPSLKPCHPMRCVFVVATDTHWTGPTCRCSDKNSPKIGKKHGFGQFWGPFSGQFLAIFCLVSGVQISGLSNVWPPAIFCCAFHCLSAPKSRDFVICDCDAHRGPQKSLAISDTLHCDLGVRWKVASDLKFRVEILRPKPFFLRDFWRFGSINAEISRDCDCAILVR